MSRKILDLLKRKPFALVGHRGAAGLEPENTIRSIKKAIEIGVDIVEVDVRSTKDGKLVLLHDEDFNRLANLNIKLRDLSLSETRNIRIKGERIATLEEAITTIDGVTGLFVEIKEPDVTESVIDVVKEYGAEPWTAIVSFYDEALIKVARFSRRIITGLIYFKPPGRIFEAKRLGARIVLPRYNIATVKANAMAHKLGLYVVTWTINTIELAKKLLKNGVDAIASDYPNRLAELRDSM